MKRIAAPAVLALLLVPGLTGLGLWNRGGAPLMVLTVTEREAALGQAVGLLTDEAGEAWLDVRFTPRPEPVDARTWLTDARLAALGFDLTTPIGSPEAEWDYRRALPRRAWVVFELDGPAWRDIDRRLQLRRDAGPAGRAVEPAGAPHDAAPPVPPERGTAIESSRLVPVDAGLDRAALAARYAGGRHLVLPATIALGYVPASAGGPFVYGYVRGLEPPRLALPRALAERIAALPRDAEGAVRYEVDLAVGRLGVPYVRDLRLREVRREK